MSIHFLSRTRIETESQRYCGLLSWSCFCGEEELVRQVHTLLGRNAQVVYELQVQEEMEGVRQELREVERENKARRNAHMNLNMWME